MEGNEQLKKESRDYFKRLYHEEHGWRPKLDYINFRTLDESSKLALERKFSKEEILESLVLCKRDKTSGTKGFNMDFLQEFWHIIKKDIL